MKTPITIAITALFASSLGQAALSVYDSFLTGSTPASGEYNVGNIVGQGPTVDGYTGNWTQPNSFGSAVVSASGLSYTNGSGTLVTAGGSVSVTAENTRKGRLLSAPVTAGTNTTMYMSVLLQLGAAGSNGFYQSLEFQNGSFADSNRSFQLGHGNDFSPTAVSSTNYFGLRINNQSTQLLNLGATDTNVNLFVLKFELSDSANSDSVTIWRNPNMGGAEPGGSLGTLSGFDIVFDRTSLARFSGGGSGDFISADEIRFGDSFAAVTPIPEPSSALFLIIASLGLFVRHRY